MLTPQEVSEHAFTKAFNGYNMSMVDEFLDILTADYTTLYKENATLKAKMKVLVEKVEEYRSTEDAMRKALMTAQKMADDLVAEAESKRNQLMQNAEADAKARMAELQQAIFDVSGETFNILSPKQLGSVLFEKLGNAGGKFVIVQTLGNGRCDLFHAAVVHPDLALYLFPKSLNSLFIQNIMLPVPEIVFPGNNQFRGILPVVCKMKAAD